MLNDFSNSRIASERYYIENVSLTPLQYSVQPPLSFLQYQIHSVVRMKWGGLVTEDAVDSRRTSDTPHVIDIKSTTWCPVLLSVILQHGEHNRCGKQC